MNNYLLWRKVLVLTSLLSFFFLFSVFALPNDALSKIDFSYSAGSVNYTLVNTNNSLFLLGKTWETNDYRKWWYNMTGAGSSGAGDGTGGWYNTSVYTNTTLAVNMYGNMSVDGNIYLKQSNSTTKEGIVYMNGAPFMHSSPNSKYIYIGRNSGNLTLLPSSDYGNLGIGEDTLKSLTTGYGNFALGYGVMDTLTNGYANVCVGVASCINMNSSENSNTAIGYYSLSTLKGENSKENTVIGSGAGQSVNTGSGNTLIGRSAGNLITTGSNNVAVGLNALDASTTAYPDTAVGVNALGKLTSGRATALGYVAGANCVDCTEVTYIGDGAGYQNTGQQNTFVGYFAGQGSGTGDANTCIGDWAGYGLTNGNRNVLLGMKVGEVHGVLNNDFMIGYDIDMPNGLNNTASIGNGVFILNLTATGTTVDSDVFVGIGTASPTHPLEVVGNATDGVSVWVDGNVSVGGIVDRTWVWDSALGSALNSIKTSSEIINLDGSINHSLKCPENLVKMKINRLIGYNEVTIQKEVIDVDGNITIVDEIKQEPIYQEFVEEGCLLNGEVAKHEQAIYELNTKVNSLSSKGNGSIGYTGTAKVVKDVDWFGFRTTYCDMNYEGGVLISTDC